MTAKRFAPADHLGESDSQLVVPSAGVVYNAFVWFKILDDGPSINSVDHGQAKHRQVGESPRSTLAQLNNIDAEIPRWDSRRRELHFRGLLVKRFRQPARNQELILATFEEDGWPYEIDDPLPGDFKHDARERLHDAIKNLNRNHVRPIVRFRGNGTGQGIRWLPVD
jgi:hypothetical protein